jgi:hypothetical protein
MSKGTGLTVTAAGRPFRVDSLQILNFAEQVLYFLSWNLKPQVSGWA